MADPNLQLSNSSPRGFSWLRSSFDRNVEGSQGEAKDTLLAAFRSLAKTGPATPSASKPPDQTGKIGLDAIRTSDSETGPIAADLLKAIRSEATDPQEASSSGADPAEASDQDENHSSSEAKATFGSSPMSKGALKALMAQTALSERRASSGSEPVEPASRSAAKPGIRSGASSRSHAKALKSFAAGASADGRAPDLPPVPDTKERPTRKVRRSNRSRFLGPPVQPGKAIRGNSGPTGSARFPVRFVQKMKEMVTAQTKGSPGQAVSAQPIRANESRFRLEIPALGQALFVRDFEGREEISSLYSFSMTVLSEDADILIESAINQVAMFTVTGLDGFEHPFGGIIKGFRQTGRVRDHFVYEVELAPRIWRLSLNYQTRIFQHVTVEEIITQAMADCGMSRGTHFEFRLSRKLPVREYTTQYRETDLDFVSRLLEHEGIHYYFEHSELGEKLIMTDDSLANPEVSGGSRLTFNQALGMNPDEAREELITDLSYDVQLVTGRVLLKDYNYETPNQALLADSQINGEMPGTFYEYGDHYKDQEEGQALAAIRNEEIESGRVVISASSPCSRIRSGHHWSLVDHFRENLNQSYLITSVTHTGSQPGLRQADDPVGDEALEVNQSGYRNEFTCIPASTVFRPARKTPIPNVPGIMTARMESAGGEYAYIDDDGRYRVRMPFDLDGTPEGEGTKPIRLAQPYSGADYGMHFPHHENTEMIWACVDGNIDRPLGLGTAPNPNNASPATASNRPQNVIRTWGKNELTFDDTLGEENILMIATKDHTVEIANDEFVTIERDHTTTVRRDRSITVEHDETKHVVNDQSLTVDANRSEVIQLDETSTINGSRTSTIALGETHTVSSGGRTVTVTAGDQTTSIGSGNRTTTVNGNDLHAVTGGSRTVQVTSGDDTLVVQGTCTTSVQSGTYLVDVGGASARIQCGASSITLGHDGTITLKGSRIHLDADETCHVNAHEIESRATGRSRFSAPSMFVTGSQVAAMQSPELELNGSARYEDARVQLK